MNSSIRGSEQNSDPWILKGLLAMAILFALNSLTVVAAPLPDTSRPTVTTVTPQIAIYRDTDLNIPLLAYVSTSGTLVDEGNVTFTVSDSQGNVVGSPVVSSEPESGLATARYLLPGGTLPQSLTIKADYSGEDGFKSSSGASTLLVTKAPTISVAAAAFAHFSAGTQTVALTATVNAIGATVNNGTITFTVKKGSTVLGLTVSGNVVNGSTTANYVLPAGTAVGLYTINVSYSGSPNFVASSSSGILTVRSQQTATATTAGPISVAYSPINQNVVLNASVSSLGFSINDGTITFAIKKNSQTIGLATTGNVANGHASATYVLPAGTPVHGYSIQATYSGGTNYLGSSDTASFDVTAAPTSIGAQSTSAYYRDSSQPISLSATVISPGFTVNEGTVTFTVKNGQAVIGVPATGNVANGNAGVSFEIPGGTAPRNYTIQTTYSAGSNSNITGSTGTASLTVLNGQTAIAVDNKTAGYMESSQNITLAASVSSPGSVVNEGQVSFTVKDAAGKTIGAPITSSVLSNGSVGAVYTLPGGTLPQALTIVGQYSGGTRFGASSDTLHSLTIGKGATATNSLDRSAVYSLGNQNISLSATVTASGLGINEGSVTFTVKNGALAVGIPVTANVLNGESSTIFVLPGGTLPGSLSIIASYSGSAKFASGSDGTHKLSIGKAATNTSAQNVSRAYSDSNQSIPLAATVSGGTVNGGTVTFTVKNNSGTVIGAPAVSSAVAGGGAAATYSLPGGTLPQTLTIVAEYSGDAKYSGSSDATHTVIIGKSETVTSAQNTAASYSDTGQNITLAALVSGGTINEGTVTFTVKTSSGSVVGVAVTSAKLTNGNATGTFNLPGGTIPQTLTIAAEYSGGSKFNGSNDSAHTFTISKATTATAAANAEATYRDLDQNIALSATVAGPGVSQGTVTFTVKDGDTIVGTPTTSTAVINGFANASFVLPGGTAAKTYTVAADYNGGTNFLPSGDGQHSLTVHKASFVTTIADSATIYSDIGRPVRLTAKVYASASVLGSVTFMVKDGSVIVGSPVIGNPTLSSAQADGTSIIGADYVLPGKLDSKSYTLMATTSGSSNWQGSSVTATLNVLRANASVIVGYQSANYSLAKQEIPLTAIVTTGAGRGHVIFTVKDGGTIIGSPTTSTAWDGPTATGKYVLPSGTAAKRYTLAATYSANPNVESATGEGVLIVNPPPHNTLPLTLPSNGITSETSSGAGELQVAYGVLASTLSTNPVLFANIGYSGGSDGPLQGPGNSGTSTALVTEVGISASRPLHSTRIFVDYTGSDNSGVALVNPSGDSAISISAEFRDRAGTSIAVTSIPLDPGHHTAVFASQLVPNLPNPFLGTLTLSSADAFVAVSLGTALNGHGEILYSSLPAPDLDASSSGRSGLVFSHLVAGAGYTTQILLLNPSDTAKSIGSVKLYDDSGAPLTMDFGAPEGPQSRIDYTLPPNGMLKLVTKVGGDLRTGYGLVATTSGPTPIGSGVFLLADKTGLITQAGVPSSSLTTAARLFVEIGSTPLYRNTGVAIVNPNPVSADLTLKLTTRDGEVRTRTLTIGPNAHVSKFVTELFNGSIPPDFQGSLDVTSSVSVATLTLRLTVNQRGTAIYSTLPVADLLNPPQGQQFIPQIVNGGGYKTQIIVVDTSGQGGDILLSLFNNQGQLLQGLVFPDEQ